MFTGLYSIIYVESSLAMHRGKSTQDTLRWPTLPKCTANSDALDVSDTKTKGHILILCI